MDTPWTAKSANRQAWVVSCLILSGIWFASCGRVEETSSLNNNPEYDESESQTNNLDQENFDLIRRSSKVEFETDLCRDRDSKNLIAVDPPWGPLETNRSANERPTGLPLHDTGTPACGCRQPKHHYNIATGACVPESSCTRLRASEVFFKSGRCVRTDRSCEKASLISSGYRAKNPKDVCGCPNPERRPGSWAIISFDNGVQKIKLRMVNHKTKECRFTGNDRCEYDSLLLLGFEMLTGRDICRYNLQK